MSRTRPRRPRAAHPPCTSRRNCSSGGTRAPSTSRRARASPVDADDPPRLLARATACRPRSRDRPARAEVLVRHFDLLRAWVLRRGDAALVLPFAWRRLHLGRGSRFAFGCGRSLRARISLCCLGGFEVCRRRVAWEHGREFLAGGEMKEAAKPSQRRGSLMKEAVEFSDMLDGGSEERCIVDGEQRLRASHERAERGEVDGDRRRRRVLCARLIAHARHLVTRPTSSSAEVLHERPHVERLHGTRRGVGARVVAAAVRRSELNPVRGAITRATKPLRARRRSP